MTLSTRSLAMTSCKTTLTGNGVRHTSSLPSDKGPLDAIGVVEVPLEWSPGWFAENEVAKMLITAVYV